MNNPINIIIDKPLCNVHQLGVFPEIELTVYDSERNLANLLVKYGFFPSKSELRRNRPDLLRNLDKPDFERIKIGKKIVWIIIGTENGGE